MGRYLAFFILVFICSTQPGRLDAQVKASASFDLTRVEAGDTFSLRVLVAGVRVAPKRVSFAAWQKQIPADNILSRSDWNRSGTQWVKRFTLITFDSAELVLPPLTVQLHLNDTVQTNPLQLLVTAPRASSEVQDMVAIRDIQREPELWYDYWPWGLGAALILVLLYWFFPKTKKRAQPAQQPVQQAPPTVPPHEIALQKLATLEKEKPWLKNQHLAYYSELSIIVREYLEKRYGILALESTTREIAHLLKKTNFPETQKPALDFLLQQTDLVKYAEIQPPESYHEQALGKAKNLIVHCHGNNML